MKHKLVFIVTLVISFVVAFLIFTYIKDNIHKSKNNNSSKTKEIVEKYSKYVTVVKETELYKKDDNKYNKAGKINKDVKIILSDSNNSNTKYYKIDGIDYYINSKDVKAVGEFEIDSRYKNYIPFNKNIKTSNTTVFYDENDNYIYQVDESIDFKVLVMDTDKYGVEYNNRLVYIHSDSVESIYDNDNGETNKDKIRTLTYHFIYNPEKSECKEDICHTLEQFESELKYLNENDYFTMKLNELEMYLDGNINIP